MEVCVCVWGGRGQLITLSVSVFQWDQEALWSRRPQGKANVTTSAFFQHSHTKASGILQHYFFLSVIFTGFISNTALLMTLQPARGGSRNICAAPATQNYATHRSELRWGFHSCVRFARIRKHLGGRRSLLRSPTVLLFKDSLHQRIFT